MNDLILIGNEDGDWEGLYVDGVLFREGHSITTADWIELIKRLKTLSGNVKQFEFTVEQMEELGCSFPVDISDIPVSFFK